MLGQKWPVSNEKAWGLQNSVSDSERELYGGSKPQTRSLRKTDGHKTKSHDEEIKRWREHFEGVLNCDAPETCCEDLEGLDDIEELEIGKGDVSNEEIQRAIKNLKNGKASGSDKICPEMIKHMEARKCWNNSY